MLYWWNSHQYRQIKKGMAENAGIGSERLSEGSGLCPENPQGTRPLTLFPGSARTRPRRRQGKAQRHLSHDRRMIREPYVKGLSRHILTEGSAPCSGIPRFP